MKSVKKSLRKFVFQRIRVNSRSRYPQSSAVSNYPWKSAFTGLIQVYTGDGKGKTTAAVGQVIRALGQGLRVCFIQFFKDPKTFTYGEQKIFYSLSRKGILRDLPGIDLYTFAPQHPHFFKKIKKEETRKQLKEGLNFIHKIFREKDYDLLVLDELIIALRDKYLETNKLIKLLKQKPKNMEIILTGRGAPKKLLTFVDLVTEMKKIKHPYDKGVKVRKGIEY